MTQGEELAQALAWEEPSETEKWVRDHERAFRNVERSMMFAKGLLLATLVSSALSIGLVLCLHT